MNPLTRDLAYCSETHQHLIERLDSELSFAAVLCERHPDRARRWRPLITAAEQPILRLLTAGTLDGLAEAVRDAETLLAPLASSAKQHTIHCVGHAHIDMNWMWSWPETVAVTLDTFSTVLRLMDEYPAFRFSQSQASTYAIVEQHHPDLLRRISRRIREGRWEVTASHWVECDKNMTSAESLARQILYTRRYLHALFGLTPEDVPVDWSADTFGHAATVPNYLAQGAVRYLYLHRPGIHTPGKPLAFWWRGTDGSRVLVQNAMTLGYNGVLAGPLGRHHAAFVKTTGGTESLYVYGVGDHGGGPTRKDILCGLDKDTWPIFPNIRFSTARAFFQALEGQASRLPVLAGELNTEFAGCYTTQSLIKRINRVAENRLVDAETATLLAGHGTGHPYPGAPLTEAWRDTLFSQFHDILPGSCTPDAKSYTFGLYQKAMAATASLETQALRALAAKIDTSIAGAPPARVAPPSRVSNSIGAGVGFLSADGRLPASDQTAGDGPRPVVLFNPTAFARNEVVETVIWEHAPDANRPLKQRAFTVCHAGEKRPVPVQIVKAGTHWGHHYATLAFPASVAGFGYALYTVTEAGQGGPAPVPARGAARLTAPKHHCSYSLVERATDGIENEHVRLELDRTTGGIRSLVMKANGIDLIAPSDSAALLEYTVERPHSMSAWLIDSAGPAQAPALESLTRLHEGPCKAALELKYQLLESTITLVYELRADDPQLYVSIKASWFQRGSAKTGVPALTLRLPLALQRAKARYEIPFGAIDRSFRNHEEVPALQWAQVSGTVDGHKVGCLLINDCKHGHSLDGNVLRLTLIRSAYQPDPLPEIGEHDIAVALRPFAGDMPAHLASTLAQAFNRPLRAVSTDIHQGPLPAAGAFLQVSGGPVVVTALKRAEDGEALVVRLYNPAARRAAIRIRADGRLLGRLTGAQPLDLMERPCGKPLAVRDGNVSMEIGPNRFITLGLTLTRSDQRHS